MYEIRRGGQVICASSIPDCGYSKEILRDMQRSGMRLYCEGKRKATGRGANSDGGKEKTTITRITDNI